MKPQRRGKRARHLRLRRELVVYAAIGALAVTIDVLIFRRLAAAMYSPEIAAIGGGAVSMAVHFTLNKFITFRNHDRPTHQQLGTYCAVVSVWWVITLTVVAVLTRGFGVPPVAAKLVAVAINFPIGFFGQRYLTFGAGIAAALRRRHRAA